MPAVYQGTNGYDNYFWCDDGPNLGEPIVMLAYGGSDIVGGDYGDDFIYGGDGDDDITGFGGLDYLFGEAGNDTLDGDDGSRTIPSFGSADVFVYTLRADILDGGAGADHFDADALDIVTYDSSNLGLTVDLLFSGLNTNDAAGDSYNGVVNLRGSLFNDTLAGNDVANIIDGSQGNDLIWARYGNDTVYGGAGDDILYGERDGDFLDGGPGSDWAKYTYAPTGVTVDLLFSGSNTGEAAGDTFVSIENLEGSNYNDGLYASDEANTVVGLYGNDYIFGRLGNDFLFGNEGNDVLLGEGGADWLDGGPDIDWVSYYYYAPGVVANLANSSPNTGDAYGDTYVNIENLEGSLDGSDTLYGNALSNTIYGWGGADGILGRDGNDILYGHNGNDGLYGEGGADTIYGGADDDWIDGGAGADYMEGGSGNDSYQFDDLGDVIVENGGGTDTIYSYFTFNLQNSVNVENLILYGYESLDGYGNALSNVIGGNDGNNILQGNGGSDQLYGYGGTDTLYADDGDDTLEGGAGADTMHGGAGFDTASYSLAGSGITANLDIGIGAGGDAQGDTYTVIEGLLGSNFGDTLVGRAGVANTLNGGGGDDFLYGEGVDTFVGGAGNDVLFGGQGSALNINLGASSLETVWGSYVGDVMNGSTATAALTMVGQGLTGGANADTMTGGSGNDFVYYRAGDVIAGGAGNDWAVAMLSASGVTLNMTTAGFENAWGSTSADTITAAGSATTVVLVGDTGNDVLTGGSVGDFLYGFAGDDTLTGGAGNDNLVGGADTDAFAFSAGWGTDIVWDWQDGVEKFNLQGSGAASYGALTVNQNLSGSGNAYITFGSNHILVVGGANQIDAGDFIF